ncbi:MAG: biotin/lipoyl-binding protein [Gammaproteobacteria bacterium]|nr:MAG: biotin/lipoyl-binding protein [Gammaproteobacteria bacterium]
MAGAALRARGRRVCHRRHGSRLLRLAPRQDHRLGSRARARLGAARGRARLDLLRRGSHQRALAALRRILRSARFLEVRHDVALLDQGAGEFAGPPVAAPEALILAALALHAGEGGAAARQPAAGSPWDLADGFTPNLPARVAYGFSWRGHTHAVELEFVHGRPAAVTVNGGVRLALADAACSGAVVAARIETRRRQARYHLDGARVYLWTADEQYELVLEDPRTHEFSPTAATGGLTTPLPGVVVAVLVAVGQRVSAGEVLMVIEAMKMEHAITAPYAGTVETIHFARGERVPEGSALLELARDTGN